MLLTFHKPCPICLAYLLSFATLERPPFWKLVQMFCLKILFNIWAVSLLLDHLVREVWVGATQDSILCTCIFSSSVATLYPWRAHLSTLVIPLYLLCSLLWSSQGNWTALENLAMWFANLLRSNQSWGFVCLDDSVCLPRFMQKHA